MLVKNVEETNSDYVIVAIPKKESHGSQKLRLTGKDSQLSGVQPIYFSQVEENRITGFQINKKLLSAEKVWQIDFGNKETIIDVKTQYTSASLAAEHS